MFDDKVYSLKYVYIEDNLIMMMIKIKVIEIVYYMYKLFQVIQLVISRFNVGNQFFEFLLFGFFIVL